MPIILGEPVGPQPQASPLQVVGPFVFQGNLAANTSATLRVPAAAGNQWTTYFWNLLYTQLVLRGISGTINANGIPAANTLTITPAAAASSINGTETGTALPAAAYATQGGVTGNFAQQFSQGIGLPFTRGGGTVLAGNLIATAAGALDISVWLHLDA